MTHTFRPRPDATANPEQRQRNKPPMWQFAVTLLVALCALVALVMFVYGFYAMRSR